MLLQLSIHNFGLINQLSLEFNEHLNILTGETGVGKSIVIDALRIALGHRITVSQLRDRQDSCLIEAVFDLSGCEVRKLDLFQGFCSEDDASFIVSRTFTPEGRNKIKINGQSVTMTQLKDIGRHLMDFHGHHDHQMLLSSESHIGILDRLVDFKNTLSEYQTAFTEYSKLKQQLESLRSLSQSQEREIDLISHQVKELEQVSLEEQEYRELLQEQGKVNNAEKLSESAAKILYTFENDQGDISETIRQAFAPVQSLNQLDEYTSNFMEQLSQIQEIIDQFVGDVRDYYSSLSFDPQTAQTINAKCDLYGDILRKYGPTLSDARQFYEQVKEKHNLLSDFEKNDAQLSQQVSAQRDVLAKIALKITQQRKKSSASLKKTIEKELSELGITHVQFEGRIEPCEFHSSGCDQVIFYISPNAGEDLKPLADIVSSGEAARVMLALKKALIKVDPIPVLIFDEIDAQIGGRLGTVTGQKLRDISRNRQVILITHIPQIASFADAHFKISKIISGGRALTQVDHLDKDSRVQEIAQMMSGKQESQISIKHAHDLLAQASFKFSI